MECLHVEGAIHAEVAENDGRVHLVVELVPGDDLLETVQDLFGDRRVFSTCGQYLPLRTMLGSFLRRSRSTFTFVLII